MMSTKRPISDMVSEMGSPAISPTSSPDEPLANATSVRIATFEWHWSRQSPHVCLSLLNPSAASPSIRITSKLSASMFLNIFVRDRLYVSGLVAFLRFCSPTAYWCFAPHINRALSTVLIPYPNVTGTNRTAISLLPNCNTKIFCRF
jgi:hypothetical protein